jgi:hypothetical protein
MNCTDPHEFVAPRYTYARVERALLAVFGIAADRQGPLRARLKHLNLLGMPGLKVGKGQRIAYSLEQVAQWMIALLIEETGVDPTVAARLVKETWGHGIGDWARLAVDKKSEENHVFLKLRPQLMTGPWVHETSPLASIRSIGGFQQYLSAPGGRWIGNVERELIGAVRDRKWICLRDLTADFEVLMNSLDGEKS